MGEHGFDQGFDRLEEVIVATFFDRYTLMCAAGIFLLLRVLRNVQAISSTGVYRRLLPLLPEALGVGAALAGGLPAIAGKALVIRLSAGLWCGYVATKFHKVLGQTILGDDDVIANPGAARRSIPPPTNAGGSKPGSPALAPGPPPTLPPGGGP